MAEQGVCGQAPAPQTPSARLIIFRRFRIAGSQEESEMAFFFLYSDQALSVGTEKPRQSLGCLLSE